MLENTKKQMRWSGRDGGKGDGCIAVGTRVGSLVDGDRVAALGLSERGFLVGNSRKKGGCKNCSVRDRGCSKAGLEKMLELEFFLIGKASGYGSIV